MKCSREIGGEKAQELRICPAYPDHGRHCARIVGTLCGGEVQGTFARKYGNCRKCRFYKSRHYERMLGSADEKRACSADGAGDST